MSITTLIPRVIAQQGADPATLARQCSAFAAQPPVRARVKWSGAGLVRTFDVQVVNQEERPCIGLFLLAVAMGDTAAGAPSTGRTITLVSAGVLVFEIMSDAAWLFYTGADGRLTFEITQAGVWVPTYPRTTVLGATQGTDVVN